MRLRRRAEFLHVQHGGHKLRRRHVMLFVLASQHPSSRIGFTVSRKVGGAVVRNKVRRRLREIVRQHENLLAAGWDYVVIASPSAASATFHQLHEDVHHLLAKAYQQQP